MRVPFDKSLLHSGIPTECATANVVADWKHLEFPGIFGTGFFARRDRDIFYFTALHCLRSDTTSIKPSFNLPLIPYRHTGKTSSPEHFIQLDTGFTIDQYRDQELQGSIDLIGCPILQPTRSKDFKHLLSRSAKLPSSGAWLEDYMISIDGQKALDAGDLSALVIGFPRGSPRNGIHYAEQNQESLISTEAVVLLARVGFSELEDCLRLEPSECPYDFQGFSGSPVFARISSDNGPQYALIGMVVCGSSTSLNFLRVGRLIDAIKSDT